MRLLHVIRTLNPDFGGPTDSVRMFAAAHQRAGNQVEVATLDDPAADFSRIPGGEVHAFGPTKPNYHYEPRLEKWLRENVQRFDGVIVNGIWQYHALAARRAVAGKRPYVVFSHGMLDPYFRTRYPLKHLKKLFYWTLFEHQNLNRAEAVCFTSEEEKRIAGEGFPFRHFKGVVIPYGTIGPPAPPEADPAKQREAFIAAFPALRGKPYLLYLSRIHPKKGCDLLIEAFARTAPPEMQLVLAGPDEVGLRPELDALAARLNVTNRVHWTGTIRGDLKWGAFYGAEAFILPSHQENFGIAVADALACGVIPLISDKVNIAPDIASDGAGIMEPDTLEGTTRLIERFLAMTHDERDAMRARGLDCYQTRYALRNSVQEVYKALGLAPR
ncbi:glycosyltransferase [Acidicapsa ligni]|uniref:glycosyltransferase n=1 Tax=Acidicapsa ligni TaxID=542300 RepID=UPI0021E07A72|nr:glycosyltransferase [Acidicapsa ligni]